MTINRLDEWLTTEPEPADDYDDAGYVELEDDSDYWDDDAYYPEDYAAEADARADFEAFGGREY